MRLKRTITILTAAAILGASQSMTAMAAQIQPFGDLEPGDWSESSVYALTALGVIAGYGDGTFQGDAALTREAFVRLLAAAGNLKPGSGSDRAKFQDVESDRWSYASIQQAYQAGLLDALVANGRFEPEKEITREEVAELVGRYLLLTVSSAQSSDWLSHGWTATESAKKLKDGGAIRAEAKPYLYYAVERGIMVGDASGEFRPQATLKRKEAASIIERAINDRLKTVKLQAVGYYAIQSFNNADKIGLLADVKFGWSQLRYTGPGQAALDTKTVPNAVPSGWETVTAKADAAHASKELSVYADDTNGQLSAFLADEAAQEAFIKSLGETLNNKGYGFTGVSIDFEGLLAASEQAPFTAFLGKVKSSLSGRQTLSVAVPPTRWYKGYDYKAIGKLADQVILMAYDYTHKDSRLPSAPLPLVGEAVRTALADIPAAKLVLGISKQANQWIAGPDGATTLEKPEPQRVEERLKKAGTLDAFAMPYFLDRITFQDERGSHEIWYEDERSIERKLWLAKYYGLRGVSLWYIGSLTADDWKVVQQHTQAAN